MVRIAPLHRISSFGACFTLINFGSQLAPS
jgi:hypothetical protein